MLQSRNTRHHGRVKEVPQGFTFFDFGLYLLLLVLFYELIFNSYSNLGGRDDQKHELVFSPYFLRFQNFVLKQRTFLMILRF